MIRPALPEEAEHLSALAFRSKAHWGYSIEFMEACREELSIPPADIEQDPTFVVARDHTPLGFYTLQRLSPTEVELGHLFVEPSEIGRGLGRELMAHARAEARRRGYKVLVIQGDPNAAPFYEACGARQVGSKPSGSIPGRLLPLFELALSEIPMNETPNSVRQEIVIAATPERVFDAWADPEEIARWYIERQVGDPRRDQRVTWYINCEDLAGEGEPLAVRAAERGRRLTLENVGPEPWRGTVVDVELIAEDGRTRVIVEQRGFSEPLLEHVPVVGSGWACVLSVLKEYVEAHSGEPRRTAEARREVDPDPAAVAEALASADAIAQWAGEAPARVLATTPHGAVTAFSGFPGLFNFMGVGAAVVWYTAWGEADLDAARAKAAELAERLAARVGRA